LRKLAASSGSRTPKLSRLLNAPPAPISFNLQFGTAIGQVVSAIRQVEKEVKPSLSLQTSFQGSAQAYGAALASRPILIVATLFVIHLIPVILYESLVHDHHHLDPAAGGALRHARMRST
jgi:multidrug efflux pump subunit AcrB